MSFLFNPCQPCCTPSCLYDYTIVPNSHGVNYFVNGEPDPSGLIEPYAMNLVTGEVCYSGNQVSVDEDMTYIPAGQQFTGAGFTFLANSGSIKIHSDGFTPYVFWFNIPGTGVPNSNTGYTIYYEQNTNVAGCTAPYVTHLQGTNFVTSSPWHSSYGNYVEFAGINNGSQPNYRNGLIIYPYMFASGTLACGDTLSSLYAITTGGTQYSSPGYTVYPLTKNNGVWSGTVNANPFTAQFFPYPDLAIVNGSYTHDGGQDVYNNINQALSLASCSPFLHVASNGVILSEYQDKIVNSVCSAFTINLNLFFTLNYCNSIPTLHQGVPYYSNYVSNLYLYITNPYAWTQWPNTQYIDQTSGSYTLCNILCTVDATSGLYIVSFSFLARGGYYNNEISLYILKNLNLSSGLPPYTVPGTNLILSNPYTVGQFTIITAGAGDIFNSLSVVLNSITISENPFNIQADINILPQAGPTNYNMSFTLSQ